MNLFNLVKKQKKIKFSFILQSYDMKQEVVNTLKSLTPDYQNFPKDLYEVVLIENPSENTLNENDLDFFQGNITFIQNKSNIPITKSINNAIKHAEGEYLIICVDAARILSSGILKYCQQALRLSSKSIVAFHGFHLGQFPQQKSVSMGLYSKKDEIQFLKDINYPNNPSALFFNSCWAESSSNGYFYQMAESNCLMVPKKLFDDIGGFDERIDAPSGGLANLDLYNRVLAFQDHRLFFVLGEGSFHQYHGGDTTGNVGKFDSYRKEYKLKTGNEWSFPTRSDYEYLGHIPLPSVPLLKQSAVNTVKTLSVQRPAHIITNMQQAMSIDTPVYDYNIIKVLAMHRSKSSYISRLITHSTNSIIPGNILKGTSTSNPEGHFEPHEIVALHNKILDEFDANWRSIAPIDFNKYGEAHIEYCVNRIDKLIHWGISQSIKSKDTYARWKRSNLLLIKDPRLCRLNMLWDKLDLKHQKQSKQIILIDHPTKVAQSLYKRDAIPMEWGELLWLRYNLDIIKNASKSSLIINMHSEDEGNIYSRLSGYLEIEITATESWRPNKNFTPKTKIAHIFDEFCLSGDITNFQNHLSNEEQFIIERTELFRQLDRLMQNIK